MWKKLIQFGAIAAMVLQNCEIAADSKMLINDRKSSTYQDELESCIPPSGIKKILKTLSLTNPGQIQDIKFHPVLMTYLSNYDEIREQARANAMYFLNDKGHLHGDPTPFLSGNIFLIVHGYIDSFDSTVRIFGIGE